jgi:hypothetical protein
MAPANRSLQQAGHANEGISSFHAFLRLNRLLSEGFARLEEFCIPR